MQEETGRPLGLACNEGLGAWLPIATAPRNGDSFRIPPQAGYTHCFWQGGYWWWHSVHSGRDGDYAVGPEPTGWQAGTALHDFDDEDPRCADGGDACADCLCRGACLKAPNVGINRHCPVRSNDE